MIATLISFIEVLPYVILAVAVIGIIILYVVWKRKSPQTIVDNDYFAQILSALGHIDNIKSAVKEHRRIQITLNDLEKVNTDQLKKLDISAFLTQQKITLLMNEQGDRLLNHIKSKRKEER